MPSSPLAVRQGLQAVLGPFSQAQGVTRCGNRSEVFESADLVRVNLPPRMDPAAGREIRHMRKLPPPEDDHARSTTDPTGAGARVRTDAHSYFATMVLSGGLLGRVLKLSTAPNQQRKTSSELFYSVHPGTREGLGVWITWAPGAGPFELAAEA